MPRVQMCEVIISWLVFFALASPRFASAINRDTLENNADLANQTLSLSSLAIENKDLVIAADQTVEIDASVNIEKLTVLGTLLCPDHGNFTIRTTGLSVSGKNGAFICGSESNRFRGQLKIALKPGRYENIHGVNSDRNFLVMNGGKILLFGDSKNSRWLHLNRNISEGERQIELSESVPWTPGDQIVIAPSSYNPSQGEMAIVSQVSVDQRILTLRDPLKFSHFGDIQRFEGRKTHLIDERAEVANLTRNISIFAEGAPELMDFRGGHIMVMKGSFAQIDSVELFHMGRLSEMARYPFHWHLVGNSEGQFIKNSSIHHSFQRCITVHGTNKVQVINNVCFDHIGHGFFLEDGNETDNQIIGNLGILTRRPPEGRQLLQSDIDQSNPDRFPGPSTFWVSNPQNTVVDNVAAGSEGSGFWNSFNKDLFCGAGPCEKASGSNKPNVFPLTTNTQQFDRNKAHSCMVGITWDGAADGALTQNKNNAKDRFLTTAHYSPKIPPRFSNLVVNKTTTAAIYFRGNTSHFEAPLLADNRVGLFFAFSASIKNAVIAARTANVQSGDDPFNGEFTGIRVYDGPFDLQNADFLNFSEASTSFGQTVLPSPVSLIGAWDRFTNVVSATAFFPRPPLRVGYLSGWNAYPWADGNTTPGVRDIDGGLSGLANSILVPDHPFNRDQSCISMPDSATLRCQYEKAVITLQSKRNGKLEKFLPFLVRRDDGAQTYDSLDNSSDNDLEAIRRKGYTHHFKFGVIVNPSRSYEVVFRKDWKMPVGQNVFQVFFRPEYRDSVSPILRFSKIGSGCRLVNSQGNAWKAARSIEELGQLKVNSYYSKASDVSIKLLATEPIPRIQTPGTENIKSAQNKAAFIQCK